MFFSDGVQIERRTKKRIEFDNSVTFQVKDIGKFGGCLACDISEGGLKIRFNQFLPLNTEINLQMDLENSFEHVEVPSRVAWTKRVPYSEMYYIGLEFKDVDKDSERKIRRYIQSQALAF